MNKRFNHSGFLAIAILVSLILAAVTPGMVFAEGEAPEVVPPESISPEPTESVADAVNLLAEEEVVIVDDVGEPVPMASQTAIDVLCDPDPWFYCSACAGGKSPSYATLLTAINMWDDLRGYGFIYVQGGLIETNNFYINGASPYYNTMRGIVRDVTTAGSAPNFDGYLEVYNMPAGFTLQGLRFTHTAGTGTTITMSNNVGFIKLVDIFVQHTTGSGMYISNKGSIELTRVESYGNLFTGAQLSNCVPDCTVNTGTIKVTSSSFNNNGDAAGSNHVGLFVFSKGAITLNGVSASNNKGDGLDIEFRGPLTIKNSVFTNNIADPATDSYGYGIYTYSTSTGNLSIENSIIADNGNEGALIRTLGNVTLKKVNAFSNGGSGIFIVKSEFDYSEGANNVVVTDSSFWDNGNTNISIRATGTVTITNLYSSNALLSGRGLTIDNSFAALPKSIIISKTVLNENATEGASITSKGLVNLNGITANNNGSNGIYINNHVTGGVGGVNVLSTLGPNTFDDNGYSGLHILTNGSVNLTNVQANSNSTPTAAYAGVYVMGYGTSSNVTMNSVIANDNNGYGVYIYTSGAINWTKGSASGNGKTIASTGGAFVSSLDGILKTVRLTNVSFHNNLNGNGVGINATGTVTLTNILANHNSVNGLDYVGLPAIYLLGINNQFNNNGGNGIYINNMNTVNLANLEAQNNTFAGVYLFNVRNVSISATTSGWVNQLNNNSTSYGMYIYSIGTVKINKVKSNGNGATGIYIVNDTEPLPNSVTLTNIESSNNLVAGYKGVYVESKGVVTISNIVADNNASIGVEIINNGDAITPQGVTIIKGTFESNGAAGLNIVSYGKITLSNLNASYNAGDGVSVNNDGSIFKSAVIVSGINKMLHNTAGSGLYILSDGNVTIAGVTSSDNSSRGISITTIENVILSNSRTDGNVYAGGVGITSGAKAVTVNNLTSLYNNHGLYIFGMSGKLSIYNSTLAGNTVYGIFANVVDPATDVILSNVSLFGNNGAGVETNIY